MRLPGPQPSPSKNARYREDEWARCATQHAQLSWDASARSRRASSAMRTQVLLICYDPIVIIHPMAMDRYWWELRRQTCYRVHGRPFHGGDALPTRSLFSQHLKAAPSDHDVEKTNHAHYKTGSAGGPYLQHTLSKLPSDMWRWSTFLLIVLQQDLHLAHVGKAGSVHIRQLSSVSFVYLVRDATNT